MAYQKTNWKNGTPPAINAANLNKIEDGIVELETNLAAAEDQISSGSNNLSYYGEGDEVINAEWERGSIDNSGNNSASNTEIRTSDYIDLSNNFITKIITEASTHVFFFWYDSNKNFISRGSATIDGTFDLTVNADAAYVRFVGSTINMNIIKIVKNAKTIIAINKDEKLTEAHNQIANNYFEYVCDWTPGALDDSTGAEKINNNYRRTDYIHVNNNHIKGYSASGIVGYIYVFEYASDKTYIQRKLYSSNGVNDFSYNQNTVYIRLVAHKSTSNIDILQTSLLAEKQQIISGAQINVADIPDLSEKCIHHDNFSRTMSGWEIGKNSEGNLTDNSYDNVTGVSSDDGVRVDNGLTFVSGVNTSNFAARKINAAHGINFMVEFNTPASGQNNYIIYKLKNATNFEAFIISYNGTYYNVEQRPIINNSFGTVISSQRLYNSVGYVIRLYFLGGLVAVYIDDKYCCSFYAESVDDNLYIGAYKNATAHFDFINVFDLIAPLVYNTEYLTDDGVSALPNSSISANENRYELDSNTTCYSNKSEHFILYSTDEKIYNGRRTERSLTALIPENLRTMKYEFDVYFPSSVLPDTATSSYGDIFFQLHDRQAGVARGHVPFDMSLVGDEIHYEQFYASNQASGTLINVEDTNLGKVTYDEWMHFEIYIKERYEEMQHPFTEIKINDKVVFQSRKPNCANDVKGTSAQYGEYKNNFDVINLSERYFDNFKVTY